MQNIDQTLATVCQQIENDLSLKAKLRAALIAHNEKQCSSLLSQLVGYRVHETFTQRIIQRYC